MPTETTTEIQQCERCNETSENIRINVTVEDTLLCENCIRTCQQCGEFTANRHDCEHCENQTEDDETNNVPERNVTQTEKHITKNARMYGVEIETIAKDKEDIYKLKNELPPDIGITNDGSLPSNGVELQTPKLSGYKGKQYIKKVCSVLEKNRFYVNDSCGLHIHIDGKGFTGEHDYVNVRNLWLFYLCTEDILLSFLPRSRRSNNFCLPFKRDYHMSEISNCSSHDEIEMLWYRTQNSERTKERKDEKMDSTRYRGINLHSLFYEGHAEIRYHSGSIDAQKIINWATLHTHIFDRIGTGKLSFVTFLTIPSMLTLSEKIKTFFTVLELPQNLQDYYTARAKKFNRELQAEENDFTQELTNLQKKPCAV